MCVHTYYQAFTKHALRLYPNPKIEEVNIHNIGDLISESYIDPAPMPLFLDMALPVLMHSQGSIGQNSDREILLLT